MLKKAPSKREKRDELFDKILIGKYTSIPIMLILFVLILWITIKGSNYPSEFLSKTFNALEAFLSSKMTQCGISPILISLLVDGMLKVLLWVIAVMLPPMAIFFPLLQYLKISEYFRDLHLILIIPLKNAMPAVSKHLQRVWGLDAMQ